MACRPRLKYTTVNSDWKTRESFFPFPASISIQISIEFQKNICETENHVEKHSSWSGSRWRYKSLIDEKIRTLYVRFKWNLMGSSFLHLLLIVGCFNAYHCFPFCKSDRKEHCSSTRILFSLWRERSVRIESTLFVQPRLRLCSTSFGQCPLPVSEWRIWDQPTLP